jgi:hypothetical protein
LTGRLIDWKEHMAVYVDYIREHPSGQWCHMIADTDDELHTMARQLGLRRGWLHISASGIAHYDLRPAQRDEAINLGAVEITSKELVRRGKQILAEKWGE